MKSATWRARIRKLSFFPLLAAGVAVLLVLARHRQEPVHEDFREPARPVRVVTLEPADVIPRATGYGEVTPDVVWRAVAEVGGTVTEIHPSLEKGAAIASGEVLARIDATDYELAAAQAESRLESARGELELLGLERENLRAVLDIEQRVLQVSAQEYERKKRLFAADGISRSAMDQEERSLLARRKTVMELRNSLKLVPVRRKVLEESCRLYESRLAEARRDVERTEIRLPLAARISEVSVEVQQVVQAGQTLVTAHGMERVEINAQIPMVRMAPLVEQLELPGEPDRFGDPSFVEEMGMEAVVRIESGDLEARWPARLVRISETMDPRTRTVGAIVQVERPYRMVIPGKRPPLLKGMYVEVELFGKPWKNRLVLPRDALNGGEVYRVDEEDRLERVSVSLAFVLEDLAVVREGLAAGDRVVVSDLAPAVPGMKLAPREDEELKERILREAARKARGS